VLGPVGSSDAALLAAGGHGRVVGPADHPEGGLPSLQGRLPLPSRPVSVCFILVLGVCSIVGIPGVLKMTVVGGKEIVRWQGTGTVDESKIMIFSKFFASSNDYFLRN